MIELRGPIHLVGMGGMHMSAIARILLSRGHEVSGSDLRATPLTRRWLPQALTAKRLDGVDIVPLTTLLHKPGAL